MEKVWICCLILFAYSLVASNANREEKSEHNQTLEAQPDDQDNILIELQGGYDRGRMHGEGADCGCKCVIRALDRSAFPQHYTVHSVASGPGCKCACAAPTTAHKHLEDERLNRLKEAARENRKLSAIFELLEDSVSSAEMLKLHTLITELIKRVETIERVLFQNKTNEKENVDSVSPMTEITQSSSTTPPWQEKLKQQREKSSEAAAYQHVENKYEERFMEVPLTKSGHGSEDTVRALQEQERQEREKHPKMIVRGITYYKSDPVDEAETEENTADDESHSGDSVIDLLTEDELIPLGAPAFRPVSKTWQVTATPKTTTQVGTITQSELENQIEQADSPLPVKLKMLDDPMLTLTKTSQSFTERSTELRDLQSPAPTDHFKTVRPTAQTTTHSIPGNLTGSEHTKEEKPTTQTMLNTASNFITTDSNSTVSEINRSFKPTTVAAVITQSESELSVKTLPEQTLNTSTNSSEDIIRDVTNAQTTVTTATRTQTIQSTIMLETSPTMVTDKASSMATTSETIATTPTITTTTTNFETTESPIIENTPAVTESDTDFSTATSITTESLTTTTINSSKPASTSYMDEEKEVRKEEHSKPKTIKPMREENIEQKAQKRPGECMDTLATIAEPIEHNTYGHYQGAWIKDPLAHDKKIYVANYFYGNDVLEFQHMEAFKQGRFTNSYKLPYSWLGTGHAVYDGAFFFNRAFSRDIIKYDLRRRRVAAWTMIHDAALESDEVTSLDWTARSDVELAVDESGLWVIYAALDDEGFFQEVMVLSRLDPNDLSMQRETTWRTGLRRGRYGNCFIVCGVLYATDNHREQRERHLSYAFDTHTNTQMTPRLPFSNNSTYIAQIYYNPKERALYVWDNGHQVTYGVVFAYAEPV